MKRFAFLLFTAAILAPQIAAPEVEITAEPHHHLVIDNPFVRVFDLEVPPRADTLMHWHRHDYIWVTLGASEVLNTVEGKAPATVKLQDGETGFSSAPFAHFARNLLEQPFRNVTIELVQDDKLRSASAHWDEERGLDILTGGTKQILFVKDGVRVSEFELQPGGVVPLHHHVGPHLVVAVTDFDLRSDVQGKGPVAAQLKAGESKWMPGGYSHTLTNVGKQAAKFVTLEFP
jgi:quercetin dioxygenase-like cupin family protein